ncbi:MAG: lysozyme inhibitor LprI family protein [Pyrinomonadaceae bacterium]
MTRLYLSFLVLLLLPLILFAQETSTHPIDKALDACTDKDGSTAGTIRCTDKAYAAWDRELNQNYVQLMRQLKPAQKVVLKTAQLDWLKYRDSEFKVIDSIYDTLQGTMYIPMRIAERLEVVKRRAVALAGYIDLLNEGSP